jgi:hypothetical protein
MNVLDNHLKTKVKEWLQQKQLLPDAIDERHTKILKTLPPPIAVSAIEDVLLVCM